MNQSYLLDIDFLTKLQSFRHREIYARVTCLSWEEQPIEWIEGKVTGGSINIDGNSAVRRTCSLNLIAKEVNINNFLWGLHSKFKLEIGLTNKINSNYPDIIWFKQGMFVATALNISYTTNNYSISLNGKDKMCMLNGEIGGNFPQSIDFGTEEYIENINDNEHIRTIKKIPIINIIREMMQNYGNELAKNIILNDIEDNGVDLIDYKGNTPIYLIREKNTQIFINMIIDNNMVVYINGETETVISDEEKINYDPLIGNDLSQMDKGLYKPTEVTFSPGSNNKYVIAKVEYGTAMGYRLRELVYPQDLIANVGDTITSILDKLKSMLGDFEYFYDLDGRFIFRKKPIYMDHTWNSESKQLEIAVIQQEDASVAYYFNNSNLITSFGNQPNLLNARNDYTVWGVKKGLSGADIYIHARYAIDHKPEIYISMGIDSETYAEARPQTIYYSDEKYKDIELESNIENRKFVDWREIIFQMAVDYRRYYHDDDFLYNIAKNNRFKLNGENIALYQNGKTGYEQYYTDIGPDAGNGGAPFWRQLYSKEGNWLTDKLKNIESLIFWFDFLESQGTAVESISVPVIGDRPKAVNDNNVKSIYYREVPNILFVQESDKTTIDRWSQSQTATEDVIQAWGYDYQPGYVYIQLPNYLENLFSISTRGKSAMTAIDEMLYSTSYCIESVNINAIPVYSLEPNTRISITDKESGIDGEYLVSRLSIPLTYNGTMSITATKAVDTIV